MKVIQMLCERIDEEISDARFYAKKAIKYESEYPELANALHEIAAQEMEHMNLLHKHVVKIIEDYRAKHGNPPANMLAVYDYLHNKSIEKAADVKRIMQMYKN